MKVALGFLLTALLGAAVASLAVHFLANEVNSVILLSVGVLSAICNAGGFQVLTRRKDILTAKPLADWHQDRMEFRLQKRQRKTLAKWVACFLIAIITATCGGLLRVSSLQVHATTIAVSGYVAGVNTIILVILILYELSALTNLWEALRRDSMEEERRQEFFRKVKA